MAESSPAKVATEEIEKPADPEVKQTRSIFLTGFGGPKYVKLQSKPQREIGKGEISIEVDACGVSFLDLMMRQGLLENTGKTPFIMGSECCGTVTEVGEAVTQYKVGDKVVVLVENGAWTERMVVTPLTEAPEVNEAPEPDASAVEAKPRASVAHCTGSAPAVVLPYPSHFSPNEAAISLLAYLPAYLLLHKVACVRSGDVILVHSAGGGVGTAIGQLLSLCKDIELIGTASPAKHEEIKKYYPTLLNHSQDYVAEIRKKYPHGISVVLDCLSGEDTNKAIGLLKPLGRYVICGSSNFVTGAKKNLFSFAKSWIQMDRINPLKLYEESKILGGFSLKSMIFRQHGQYKVVLDAWKELLTIFESKQFQPIVDSEWSFEEVKDAMQKLQDRSNIGKIVISPKLKPKESEPVPEEVHNGEPEAAAKP